MDSSIARYDGMILREREYILNRANEKGSQEALEQAPGGVPFDEDMSDDETAPQADAEVASRESNTQPDSDASSGSGNLPAGDVQARTGDYQHRGQFPPPADIPSGDDDDVVARQIREAALRETDPVLREKLWQEYRRYKNNSNKFRSED